MYVRRGWCPPGPNRPPNGSLLQGSVVMMIYNYFCLSFGFMVLNLDYGAKLRIFGLLMCRVLAPAIFGTDDDLNLEELTLVAFIPSGSIHSSIL